MLGESMFEGREVGGHEEKTLYVDLYSNGDEYEGLIADPYHLREDAPKDGYNYLYSEKERRKAVDFYIDFLHKKPRQRLEIITEMGPAELANVLKQRHHINFKTSDCLEYVIAYFHATRLQAEELTKDLKQNPNIFYESEHKQYLDE
jgi:hypothetical protein